MNLVGSFGIGRQSAEVIVSRETSRDCVFE